MGTPATTKRTVFFTMILHPVSGWTRVGNAYGSRASASCVIEVALIGRDNINVALHDK